MCQQAVRSRRHGPSHTGLLALACAGMRWHALACAGMRWHAASRTVTDIPLLREREIPVRMSIRARRIASITFLGMPPLTPARALGRMRPAMIRPQRGTVVFGSSGLEAPFATRVVGYASSAAQHSLPVH